METAIDQVRTMLNTLPADASLEDIQYHLYVIQKIQQGLNDIDSGRVISHEEMKKEIRSWQKK
jgi:predicted transcriptional regulator